MDKPQILIIRPEERAAADVAVCHDAGWQPLVFSPLHIDADTQALKNLGRQFAAANVVFWVSPTAVETAASYVDFSAAQNIQLTVGKASKKALEAYCPYPIIAPESGNDSEAVLELAIWDKLPNAASVLIIRGYGGREVLRQALFKKGLNVAVAEVYFRRHQMLDWTVFHPEKIKAAYITSTEQVEQLFAQMPPEFSRFFQTLLYLTHHPRIAEALRRAGAHNIQTITALDTEVLAEISCKIRS